MKNLIVLLLLLNSCTIELEDDKPERNYICDINGVVKDVYSDKPIVGATIALWYRPLFGNDYIVLRAITDSFGKYKISTKKAISIISLEDNAENIPYNFMKRNGDYCSYQCGGRKIVNDSDYTIDFLDYSLKGGIKINLKISNHVQNDYDSMTIKTYDEKMNKIWINETMHDYWLSTNSSVSFYSIARANDSLEIEISKSKGKIFTHEKLKRFIDPFIVDSIMLEF